MDNLGKVGGTDFSIIPTVLGKSRGCDFLTEGGYCSCISALGEQGEKEQGSDFQLVPTMQGF